MPNRVHTKTYETHFIDDANKKSFADSLRIKEGKTFALETRQPRQGGFNNNRNFN